jgi:excisionase family DNA binding protein
MIDHSTGRRERMAVPLLSVGETAQELGVSTGTIRNWIEKGYIHAFRLPSGVRRIPEPELIRIRDEYFTFAPAIEGEDEPSIALSDSTGEEEWGPVMGLSRHGAADLPETDSSDRPESG